MYLGFLNLAHSVFSLFQNVPWSRHDHAPIQSQCTGMCTHSFSYPLLGSPGKTAHHLLCQAWLWRGKGAQRGYRGTCWFSTWRERAGALICSYPHHRWREVACSFLPMHFLQILPSLLLEFNAWVRSNHSSRHDMKFQAAILYFHFDGWISMLALCTCANTLLEFTSFCTGCTSTAWILLCMHCLIKMHNNVKS